jgi:hypothetical protein
VRIVHPVSPIGVRPRILCTAASPEHRFSNIEAIDPELAAAGRNGMELDLRTLLGTT